MYIYVNQSEAVPRGAGEEARHGLRPGHDHQAARGRQRDRAHGPRRLCQRVRCYYR